MKIFYSLLILLFSNFLYSQNINWDTLESLDLTSKSHDTIKINRLINNTWYYSVRNYNESVVLIDEAFKLSTKINYLKGIGRANLAYSNYYLEKGDFQLANKFALKAKIILTKEQDTFYLRELFITQTYLSIYFKDSNKNIDPLLIYLNEETTAFQKARLHILIADIYMSSKNKKFKKAIDYLVLAKKEFTKANSDTGQNVINLKLSRFYKNSIIFYKQIGFFDKAMETVTKSLIFFKENNQKNNLAKAHKSKALIYSVVGKHKESTVFYNNALLINNGLGNMLSEMKINQHLFIAYSILNDPEKSVNANKLFVKLKDSLFNQEKHRLIIDSQIKFDTEKILAQKRLAEEKSKRDANLLIGYILISLLVFLSALFFFGRYQEKKKVELSLLKLEELEKRLTLEKLYKNSELKALKAQMNPHFIFNVLNSIQEYILSNQKNLAGDYLGKFADLMRSYLHFSELGIISINEEVINLNLYLELEKLRFEDSLTYNITVADAHLINNFTIPTMIIQPYIENALKHGLLHRKDSRKLDISIKSISEKVIECSVKDNGIGREKSKLIKSKSNKEHKSFALKATKERLDLLNFGKDAKIGVEIIDLYNENNLATGTEVVLTIPKIN